MRISWAQFIGVGLLLFEASCIRAVITPNGHEPSDASTQDQEDVSTIFRDLNTNSDFDMAADLLGVADTLGAKDSPNNNDAPSIIDAGLRDVGLRDVGRRDLGRRDVGLRDVGRRDVGLRDVGRRDVGLRDVGRRDVGLRDVGRRDIGLKDVGLKDVGVPGAGCSSSAINVFSYAANMVVCQNAAVSMTQCSAAASCCAAGWHMCTATEFLARGGATKGTTVSAWIQSSMRNGGSYYSPDDNLPACTNQSSSGSDTVGFDCGNQNTFYFNFNYYIGVQAVSTCQRLGQTYSSAKQGYWWHLKSAATTLNAAVCCQ